VLVKLLQDVHVPGTDRTVCENRASGIPTVLREMRRADSAPPEFHNRITRFLVVLPRHALLTPDTISWIEGLGADGLSTTQRMALAQMRGGRAITNQTMRNLGVEARRATVELADLVARGLAVRIGERRYARYVLAATDSGHGGRDATAPADPDTALLQALSSEASMSRRDLEGATGLGPTVVLRALDRLMAGGRVEATAPAKSPLRRYRRASTTGTRGET
jgi:ATP-dependent DNA helicase RecG